MRRPLASPAEQGATFVELFFDLVFVFSVTQVAALLHADLTWTGVWRSILVFWLVWWAWTQFTWALNAADTTHPFVELGTLTATAVAFFMAIAIPEAFSEGSLWFGVTYVLVRTLGIWIYIQVVRADAGQSAAVRLFSTISVTGLAAVLVGGLLGGAALPWLWGAAIALDVVAAIIAAREENWGIHAEHFAERHGLIVIIALGESLIIAAAGASEADFAGVVVALLGVLVSCALWWSYFPVVKPELERALASTPGSLRGAMARDTFSLTHFPMLCGIIAYAVALEEAIAHPNESLDTATRFAMALGLFLFLGGTALAMFRAACGRPVARMVVASVTAGAVASSGALPASFALAVALAGVVTVAVLDEDRAERLAV